MPPAVKSAAFTPRELRSQFHPVPRRVGITEPTHAHGSPRPHSSKDCL